MCLQCCWGIGDVQWTRSPGKTGTHFDPKSDLFMPNEGNDVRTSTACWTAMLATLVALTFAIGPMWMLKLYVVPYLVNIRTFL
jgi:omega-3 fatty acid desaturase (delta-15 desaturase)